MHACMQRVERACTCMHADRITRERECMHMHAGMADAIVEKI